MATSGKPPTVKAQRAERAAAIKGENKASKQENATELRQAKADKDPFVPKLDDAGAREQQKASVKVKKATDLAAKMHDGPPVVAPIYEKTGGTIKIIHRDDVIRERDAEGRLVVPEAMDQAPKMRMGELSGTWIQGEGFPFPGEVVIDVRRETVGDHQRFSTWTEDGTIDLPLPGVLGPGTWLVRAESLVTQVGEGRADHLPLIKVGKEIEIEVTS